MRWIALCLRIRRGRGCTDMMLRGAMICRYVLVLVVDCEEGRWANLGL